MSEREAFEAWWKTVPIHRPLAHLDAWAAWNARAAIEAQRVPDGWVLVKRVATSEMIEAAENVEDLHRRGTPNTWAKVWSAMLAESPAAPPVAQPAERKPLEDHDRIDCKHCAGKDWNWEWKAVSGHHEGREEFKEECKHCDGTGIEK